MWGSTIATIFGRKNNKGEVRGFSRSKAKGKRPELEFAHLTSQCPDLILHLDRVRELLLVPIKVLVLGRVLDIQPSDVQRDILLVKPPVHIEHVMLVEVVPSALMISDRPERRNRCISCQSGVLPEKILRFRAGEDEQVHDPRFRHPLRLNARLGVFDVDERFGPDEVEYSDRVLGGLSVDHGDVAIERHGGVGFVLEDVDVIETVRLGEGSFGRTVCRAEGEG
jgi:hypothetical protein